MPVSPFGSRMDAPGWTDFQARTGIPVLVDAAAGFDTWSDTALTSVVSFHATKSFAIGEGGAVLCPDAAFGRSEEHTSELQSLMRISYAVFCLKKKNMTLHESQIRLTT